MKSFGGYIEEKVNLADCPVGDAAHPPHPNNQLVLGDLHSNFIKLIYFLMRQHIFSIADASNNYKKFCEIYQKSCQSTLIKYDLMLLDSLLNHIEVNAQAGMVRLMGDILADRGGNDWLILKVIQLLHENNVPLEIVISNHDFEFILWTELSNLNNEFRLIRTDRFIKSLVELDKILKANLVNKIELDILVNYYKSHLKAISYSISEDLKTLRIYSHAPIGLNTIKDLATQLGVTYNDLSMKNLIETIDGINIKFKSYVMNKSVHHLLKEAPSFFFLIWNRDYSAIEGYRPAIHHNYFLEYVHGHDLPDFSSANCLSLDNYLGKSDKRWEGSFTALSMQARSFLPLEGGIDFSSGERKEEKVEAVVSVAPLKGLAVTFPSGISFFTPALEVKPKPIKFLPSSVSISVKSETYIARRTISFWMTSAPVGVKSPIHCPILFDQSSDLFPLSKAAFS